MRVCSEADEESAEGEHEFKLRKQNAGAVGGAHSCGGAPPRPAGSPADWRVGRFAPRAQRPSSLRRRALRALRPPAPDATPKESTFTGPAIRGPGPALPIPARDLPCHEAFDCRIWRRGTAKPVLIAAMAPGTGPAAQAGVGAALAASALLNILEEDMAGYLKSGRLATLLRGAAGEVQLVLERQAHPARRSIGDYATALLAVILTDNGSVIGQIGGGGALVQGEDGAWCPVRWSGEAGTANKARYLTDADAFTAFQIAELPSAPRRVFVFFQQA